MVSFLKKYSFLLGLFLAFFAMQSCNKEFEDITTTTPTQTGNTAGQLIESDANYSIFKAAVTRAGLLNALKNAGVSYTVFAPDDAAFIASGLPLATINALPVAQLNSILSYHIIPQALPSAQIPTTFPNVQMPTLLPLLATNPLVKMPIFPSRRGTALFANNIPVTQADIAVANGVVHKVARVVAPPQLLVKQILADADYSYFRAAIARGDEGQTGLNRLDSVMNYGLANITVFAPGNAAFQQLLTAMLPPGTPISEAIFAALPAQDVRGIVAYHLLGVRAFSPNLPATTSTIQTLLGPPPMPQLTVDRSTSSPRLLGAGNMNQYANFLSVDNNAVNGVVHKIDRVLLPQ